MPNETGNFQTAIFDNNDYRGVAVVTLLNLLLHKLQSPHPTSNETDIAYST